MRLRGKKAVVTGSGRGIGRAIAVRFAQEGADVVINDLDIAGPARESLAAVEGAGHRGVLIQADISRIDEARRLIDDAVRQLGPLDILVNNAGIEKRAAFVEVTEADYDEVLDVNLKGTFFVRQVFVRRRRAVDRMSLGDHRQDMALHGHRDPRCGIGLGRKSGIGSNVPFSAFLEGSPSQSSRIVA
jgi:glucose 1-dehydrogenase